MNGTRSDLEIAVWDSPEDENTGLDVAAGHGILDYESQSQPAIQDPNESWGNIYGAIEDDSNPELRPFLEAAGIQPPEAAPAPEMEKTQVAGIGGSVWGMAVKAIRKPGAAIREAGEAMVKGVEDAKALEKAAAERRLISPDLEKRMDDHISKIQRESKPFASESQVGEPTGPKYIERKSINIKRHDPAAAAATDAELLKKYGTPERAFAAILDAEDSAKAMNDLANILEYERPKITFKELAKAVDEDPFGAVLDHLAGKELGVMKAEAALGLRSITAAAARDYADLALRVAAGDYADETLARMASVMKKVALLEQMVARNATEASNVLNQQRMLARSLKDPHIAAMREAMRQTGSDPQAMILQAQAFAKNLGNGMAASEAAAKAVKKVSFFEAFMDYYKSNMLMGIPGHIANIAGSFFGNIVRTHITMPVAATVGAMRALGGKAIDRVYWSEVAANIKGSYTGLWQGLGNVYDVIVKNKSAMDALDTVGGAGSKYDITGAMSAYLRSPSATAVGRFAGKHPEAVEAALTPAYRLLRAGDELTRTQAYISHLSGLAERHAVMQGLEGAERAAFVTKVINDPATFSPALHQEALRVSREQALQDKKLGGGLMGAIVRHTNALSHDVPAVGIIAPFITTPGNIPIYILENSPFAPLARRWRQQLAAGGAEADIAMAKWLGGTAMMTLALPFYYAGYLTGGGPDNPAQRNMLVKSGWKPWSIVMGDETMASISRLQPVVGPLTSLAAGLDRAHYAKEPQDALKWMVGAVLGIGDQMLDSTMMQGFSNFMDIWKNGYLSGIPRYAGKSLANVVPYSGFWASVSRAEEVARGEGEKGPLRTPAQPGFGGYNTASDALKLMLDEMKGRLPGMRSDLVPRRYWDGEVVMPEAGMLASMISPVAVSRVKKDPATVELNENGVGVRELTPLVTVAGVTVNLMDFDNGGGLVFDLYVEEVGKARKELVNATISDSGYAKLTAGPDGERQIVLMKAMEKGKAAGEARFFDKLRKDVRENPELYAEVAKQVAPDVAKFVTQAREGKIQPTPNVRFKAKGASRVEEIAVPGISF